ncbi:MAG: hypothetical protein PHV42_04575 [Candidatus Pacebacteria bacterium]|nr:hypothetical protein [Candidatus Paceibacterota bacterium]
MALEHKVVEADLAGLKGGMLRWKTVGWVEIEGVIDNLRLSPEVIQVDLREDPLTVVTVRDKLPREVSRHELSLCKIPVGDDRCTGPGKKEGGMLQFEWEVEGQRFIATLEPPKPKSEKKEEKKEGVATTASKSAPESPSRPSRSPQRPKSRA